MSYVPVLKHSEYPDHVLTYVQSVENKNFQSADIIKHHLSSCNSYRTEFAEMSQEERLLPRLLATTNLPL